MRTIGLIGGLSWVSSLEYYRRINELVQARLGAPHSARCVLYSFDLAEIEPLEQAGRWDEATTRLVDALRAIERAGADLAIICSNTTHKLAGEAARQIHIPLLHIADATGARMRAQGLTRVGLLGTRFTMEGDFYAPRLAERFGIEVLLPEAAERQFVHDLIYHELCAGVFTTDARERVTEIIHHLAASGVQAVILGCTELPLLLPQGTASPIALIDTLRIHAEAAVDAALA
ncbi:MAG TPA: amino acid racemase [Ktedonobacterales bacterium]|nr:amino acid racemase [Ktedonobacterales bacterium]